MSRNLVTLVAIPSKDPASVLHAALGSTLMVIVLVVLTVKLRIIVLEGSVKRVMLVPFPLVTLLHAPRVLVVHIVRTIAFLSVHLDSLA